MIFDKVQVQFRGGIKTCVGEGKGLMIGVKGDDESYQTGLGNKLKDG
jgi:hypothetical protein